MKIVFKREDWRGVSNHIIFGKEYEVKLVGFQGCDSHFIDEEGSARSTNFLKGNIHKYSTKNFSDCFASYQTKAFRTGEGVATEIVLNEELCGLFYGAIGLCTESGEIQDAIKQHVFYGEPLDKVNLKEEIGDVLWFISYLCTILGCTIDEIATANIKKLEDRYPNGFTREDAMKRDLKKERETLEKEFSNES